MDEAKGTGLLLPLAIGVGVFLVARVLLAATPAVAAAIPTQPTQSGVVVRSRNWSGFIPFPDLSALFGQVRSTDTSSVLVTPGGGMQVLPPTAEILRERDTSESV